MKQDDGTFTVTMGQKPPLCEVYQTGTVWCAVVRSGAKCPAGPSLLRLKPPTWMGACATVSGWVWPWSHQVTSWAQRRPLSDG